MAHQTTGPSSTTLFKARKPFKIVWWIARSQTQCRELQAPSKSCQCNLFNYRSLQDHRSTSRRKFLQPKKKVSHRVLELGKTAPDQRTQTGPHRDKKSRQLLMTKATPCRRTASTLRSKMWSLASITRWQESYLASRLSSLNLTSRTKCWKTNARH